MGSVHAGEVLKRNSVLAVDSMFHSIEIKVNASPMKNRPGNGMGKNAWGLEWSDGDGQRYALCLGWGNTDFGGFDDRRFMRITVTQGDSVVESRDITEGVDLYKGPNFLKVRVVDDGHTEWSVGAVAVAATGTFTMASAPAPGSFKLFAKGSDIKINSLKATDLDRTPRALQTSFNSVSHFPRNLSDAASPEGIWQFLDRDNDPKWALPGGRYTLGIRNGETPGEWLIVYLDGASANGARWKPGMLKGRLFKLPFASHYNLHWVDSSFQTLDETDECSATLNDDGSILTLSFPLDRATMRFYRP